MEAQANAQGEANVAPSKSYATDIAGAQAKEDTATSTLIGMSKNFHPASVARTYSPNCPEPAGERAMPSGNSSVLLGAHFDKLSASLPKK